VSALCGLNICVISCNGHNHGKLLVDLAYVQQLFLLGTIHCMTTSPDGHVIGVGFSSGVLSTLDLRTGMSLASWKAHEADILDVHFSVVLLFIT